MANQTLLRLIEKKGLSDNELAKQGGFARPIILKLRRGGTVNIKTAFQLAIVLGRPVSRIFPELYAEVKTDVYKRKDRRRKILNKIALLARIRARAIVELERVKARQ